MSRGTGLRLPGLSGRERDVVRELVTTGGSDREIGERLGIKTSTVKSHLGRVMLRWGLHNRTQVALYATRWLDA